MLWNVSAYQPDYTVSQLRISLVSDQFGVHKTNSNIFHIYTLSKLRFIQSIRVMQCAEGWDMCCKNAVIAKSNYCSWPAWPWRQRHYNPLNFCKLLSQQQHHNPAEWNIFYTRFLLAENIKIPCLWCDGVQFDRRKCLRGRNHLLLHGQPWLHTTTPQQTVPYAIPTILPVLFNACFILIMVPLRLPAKS